jgi:hypothetical protein
VGHGSFLTLEFGAQYLNVREPLAGANFTPSSKEGKSPFEEKDLPLPMERPR